MIYTVMYGTMSARGFGVVASFYYWHLSSSVHILHWYDCGVCSEFIEEKNAATASTIIDKKSET